jgi:hypothetical protein
MKQLSGSHQELDYYIVPVVSDKKQQIDTINTIEVLSSLGIEAKRIKLLFNRVDFNEHAPEELERQFSTIIGYYEADKKFHLSYEATIFNNELFQRIRELKLTIESILADETNYRNQLRHAIDENEKTNAVNKIIAKQLALSARENLNHVYQVLLD